MIPLRYSLLKICPSPGNKEQRADLPLYEFNQEGVESCVLIKMMTPFIRPG
ncbi:MAG: hypothetical protein CENE_00777 [Candidatus Celerinatantimonas neptuna]|nr:MAG: hypothetical protein CENE_00777 [Candidatus Celerinatantimonas neptuna]